MDPVAELRNRYPRRRVMVTGAASGLGLELCRRFAAGAWTIGMFDADREGLYAAQADIRDRGATVHATVVDVTDEASFKAAFQAFIRAAEGVDVMINNAGVVAAGRMEEIPVADWSWALGVNVMGVVHGCRLALPVFRDAGKGLLINIASAAAFVSSPDMSAYNASKAAVVSLSETLHGELLDTRIQVTVALPAFFKTNLLQRVRGPEEDRESVRLLMEYSDYSAQQAAIDILSGAVAGRLYVFAPSKVKLLWYLKRLSPVRYMKRFPILRRNRLNALRSRDKAKGQ